MFYCNTRSNTAAAVLFATLVCAAPIAANASETRTVAVRSSDLNLTNDSGRAVLQQRIAHAVDLVCGPSHPRTTAESQIYATCGKQARAGALPQFDTMVAKAQANKKVAMGHNDPASE